MAEQKIEFPTAKECRFLKGQTVLPEVVELPPFISIEKGGRFLAFRYNFKSYTLGISKEGWLAGFRGALQAEKKAELIILKNGGDFLAYDAREPQQKRELPRIREVLPSGSFYQPSPWIAAPVAEVRREANTKSFGFFGSLSFSPTKAGF